MIGRVCIDVGSDYEVGSQPPEGYLAWHEWAEKQHKAGLRQVKCGRCGLWRYPQELSAIVDVYYPYKSNGEVVEIKSAVCLKCVR